MSRVEVTPTTVENLSTGVSVKIADLTAFTADKVQFDNNGDNWVALHNADASAHTVTVNTANTLHNVNYTDPVITLAAGDHALFGPFDMAALNTVGKIYLDPEVGEEAHIFYKVLKFRYY